MKLPEFPPHPPDLVSGVIVFYIGSLILYMLDHINGQWVFIVVQMALFIESTVNFRRYRKKMKPCMDAVDRSIEAMKREIAASIEEFEKEKSYRKEGE